MLDILLIDCSGKTPVVIGGDFNAWAVEWGSQKTNKRGRILLESIAKLNVVLLNKYTVSTFNKGSSSSIIDLTFISPSLPGTSTWKVLNIHTQSDHNAIEITIGNKNKLQPTKRVPTAQKLGWKT